MRRSAALVAGNPPPPSDEGPEITLPVGPETLSAHDGIEYEAPSKTTQLPFALSVELPVVSLLFLTGAPVTGGAKICV